MENNIGQEFFERTKYENLETPPQKLGVPLPDLQLPKSKQARHVSLPRVDEMKPQIDSFSELVKRRESLRQYSNEFLDLNELAYLLWMTQGVKTITDYPLTKRTVPSAGSRHPFETYLLVNRVEGLEIGLYRYLAVEHELERIPSPDDLKERITAGCLKQKHVAESAVTFIWVAVPIRTVWRYSQRGYRYMLLDAGHVCQNLYLAAESINCGVCAIAAYDDDLVNQALGLDGVNLFAIYLASMGKR